MRKIQANKISRKKPGLDFRKQGLSPRQWMKIKFSNEHFSAIFVNLFGIKHYLYSPLVTIVLQEHWAKCSES